MTLAQEHSSQAEEEGVAKGVLVRNPEGVVTENRD